MSNSHSHSYLPSVGLAPASASSLLTELVVDYPELSQPAVSQAFDRAHATAKELVRGGEVSPALVAMLAWDRLDGLRDRARLARKWA